MSDKAKMLILPAGVCFEPGLLADVEPVFAGGHQHCQEVAAIREALLTIDEVVAGLAQKIAEQGAPYVLLPGGLSPRLEALLAEKLQAHCVAVVSPVIDDDRKVVEMVSVVVQAADSPTVAPDSGPAESWNPDSTVARAMAQAGNPHLKALGDMAMIG